MGNLHSIHAGLCRTGTRMPITLSDKAADIAAAEKVVLPGDGHFDSCMKEIRRRGLCDELIRATREKPFLGICVGMQALYESSEEGAEKGLGVLAGSVLGLPQRRTKSLTWAGTKRAAVKHTPYWIIYRMTPDFILFIPTMSLPMKIAWRKPNTVFQLPPLSVGITYGQRSSTPKKAAHTESKYSKILSPTKFREVLFAARCFP